MDFIDLAVQQGKIRGRIEANIRRVLDHGQYILGPEVRDLEKELADFAGVKHAVACASGTDALLMALMAYGVGPGDAILTTPFTFFATAEVVSLLGATPVFVDIDPRTFNIQPAHIEKALAALKEKSTVYPLPRVPSLTPKGIITVDLFGLPADFDAVSAIAQKEGLFLIEDAAQSFGAEYRGKKACSLGDIACTSFYPAKPLGCYGDGGMCFTQDDTYAEILRSIRVHGQGANKYDNVRIGVNGRLDTLQAAILRAKFEIFPKEMELRQQVAKRYTELLSAAASRLVLPEIPSGYLSAWALYSVLATDEGQRARLQARLKEHGVPTVIYYPLPLHLQPAFGYLGYRQGDFPASEDCARRIFSLPMHPYLRPEEQEQIARAI